MSFTVLAPLDRSRVEAMTARRLARTVAIALALGPAAGTASAASMTLAAFHEPTVQGRWPGITATVESDTDFDVYIKTRPETGSPCASTPADDPGALHLFFAGLPAPGTTTSAQMDDPLPLGRELICGWALPAGASDSTAPIASAAHDLDVVPAAVSLVVHAPNTIPAPLSVADPGPVVSVDWVSNTPGELWLVDVHQPAAGCAADRAHAPSDAQDIAAATRTIFEPIGPSAADVDSPGSGTFKTNWAFTPGMHHLCAWIQEIVPPDATMADPQATPVLAGPAEVPVDQLAPVFYAGRTTQHHPIAFEVAQGIVFHLHTVVDERCTSGLRHIHPNVGLPNVRLHRDGTGHVRQRLSGEVDRVSVAVHGRRAKGTLRLTTHGRTGGCDSGPVRFRAHRIPSPS
jgi:hypothetical protein